MGQNEKPAGDTIQKILRFEIKRKGFVNITVIGVSMEPALQAGDVITVCECGEYKLGDILVYVYKTGELLVHRLLKIGSKYYCKGDNAFRLEDVEKTQVLGKVIAVNGELPIPWDERKIDMSYNVNRAFYECRYDVKKTKQTEIYKLYEKNVLKERGCL